MTAVTGRGRGKQLCFISEWLATWFAAHVFALLEHFIRFRINWTVKLPLMSSIAVRTRRSQNRCSSNYFSEMSDEPWSHDEWLLS